MKKILVITGTRPNFIKISLFKKIARIYPDFDVRIVHTGQHYDDNLSGIFFQQLDIQPDYFLDIEQTTPELQIHDLKRKLSTLVTGAFIPDLLILVGDVNSTRAAAEVAKDFNIQAAHVESGLRSFDKTMPEEYNRIVADNVSKFHFVTEESGKQNLLNEGFAQSSIIFSGNTMIDTLMAFENQIQEDSIIHELKLAGKEFALITLHRPSNVDTKELLQRSIDLIKLISEKIMIVFPLHPRTRNKLIENNLLFQLKSITNIIITEPLGYFSFQKLIADSKLIITDSGGIQEEATFRKKPCITIRPNTERPVTIEIGSNTLVNWNMTEILNLVDDVLNDNYKIGIIPDLWDGKSTERIFHFLSESI